MNVIGFSKKNFLNKKLLKVLYGLPKLLINNRLEQKTFLLYSVNYRLKKMDEASRRKTQLQRQLSASISSLKQSRAGSACSTQSHLSSASKLSFNCKTIEDD